MSRNPCCVCCTLWMSFSIICLAALWPNKSPPGPICLAGIYAIFSVARVFPSSRPYPRVQMTAPRLSCFIGHAHFTTVWAKTQHASHPLAVPPGRIGPVATTANWTSFTGWSGLCRRLTRRPGSSPAARHPGSRRPGQRLRRCAPGGSGGWPAAGRPPGRSAPGEWRAGRCISCAARA